MNAKAGNVAVDQLALALRAGARHLRLVKGQAYSVQELCELTGRGEVWVRKALRAAVRAAAWEVVRVERKTIIGTFQVVPGYRPKVVDKKK